MIEWIFFRGTNSRFLFHSYSWIGMSIVNFILEIIAKSLILTLRSMRVIIEKSYCMCFLSTSIDKLLENRVWIRAIVYSFVKFFPIVNSLKWLEWRNIPSSLMLEIKAIFYQLLQDVWDQAIFLHNLIPISPLLYHKSFSAKNHYF